MKTSFDSRVLRWLAYVGLCFYLLAIAGIFATKSTSSALVADSRLNLLVFPAWLSMATLTIYYGNLAARRFQIALGPFLLLAVVWCNLTACTWALVGMEGSITVALGVSAAFCYAQCWSTSLSRLFGVKSNAIQGALFGLGVIQAFAFAGTLSGALCVLFGYRFSMKNLISMGVAGLTFSLLVLLAGAFLSRRARKAARRLLEAMPAPDPAPAESVPAPGA